MLNIDLLTRPLILGYPWHCIIVNFTKMISPKRNKINQNQIRCQMMFFPYLAILLPVQNFLMQNSQNNSKRMWKMKQKMTCSAQTMSLTVSNVAINYSLIREGVKNMMENYIMWVTLKKNIRAKSQINNLNFPSSFLVNIVINIYCRGLGERKPARTQANLQRTRQQQTEKSDKPARKSKIWSRRMGVDDQPWPFLTSSLAR